MPETVQLFVTCLIDSFFPHIGEAMVAVLNRAGVRVDFTPTRTCCAYSSSSTTRPPSTIRVGMWARSTARQFSIPTWSRQAAEDVMAEIAAARFWNAPLVTGLKPLEIFYPPEDYHQEYFARNHWQPYCQMVIAPKLAKFRKETIYRLKK